MPDSWKSQKNFTNPCFFIQKEWNREIARMLEGFSQPVCIHWYSGTESDLEEYLGKGYFCTVRAGFWSVKKALPSGGKGDTYRMEHRRTAGKVESVLENVKRNPGRQALCGNRWCFSHCLGNGRGRNRAFCLIPDFKRKPGCHGRYMEEKAPGRSNGEMFQNLREFLTAGREEK